MSNIKKIIVWVGNGVGKQVRPYKYPYKPTSNTLLYMPLDWDLYKSGTATTTATLWSNASWGTVLWDLKWLSLNGTANSNIIISWLPAFSDFTLNIWVKLNNRDNDAMFVKRWNWNSAGKNLQFWMRKNQSYKTMFNFFTYDQYGNTSLNTNTRYNIIVTYNYSTKAKNIYLNWSNNWSTTSAWQIDFWTVDVYIWSNEDWSASVVNWLMSNLIIENKEWSSTEVSNYYNSTKTLYWIS